MFTGIIESLGTVEDIQIEGSNRHFTIASSISDELKIDQSVSHDGVCLTVVQQSAGRHIVTAIEETLNRSKLGTWEVGTTVNLERAMLANARLDGHMVQGHVDTIATCTRREDRDGSWEYSFEFEATPEHILVDKGSVCINGVSLTVVNPSKVAPENGGMDFSVAIIPYTWEHTTFKDIQVGDSVNIEFDILGKYIARYAQLYLPNTMGV